MSKIAFVSMHVCPLGKLGEDKIGGMNVYIMNLATALTKLGYEIDIYTRKHDIKDPVIVKTDQNIRIIHLDAGPVLENNNHLYKYIDDFTNNIIEFNLNEKNEYKIIHSHYWLSGPVGAVLKDTWGIPHLITFHTLSAIKLKASPSIVEHQQRYKVEKNTMNKVDSIIVSTQSELDDIVDLYNIPDKKIQVIPPGVDLELFKPLNKIESKKKLGLNNRNIILYVGRIDPIKGLYTLLDSVFNINTKYDPKLILIGGDLNKSQDLIELKNYTFKKGKSDVVDFVGLIDQSDLPIYYNAAEVFLLTSFYESFGLSVLESLACGTPAIVSNVGGLSELIDNGTNGYLVSENNARSFTNHIEAFFENERMKNSSINIRLKAESYQWSKSAKNMSNIYTKIFDGSLN
ncbi:MAG: hypothetical protein CL758_08160 [Chloroflexi bacterium]|nr:hypothetical protein [Chloroflexota bacterium]|tara:strand:- start:69634 stop:70839 length:1206 start_codon:yes stop_codon:yes gene_type:complete